MSTIKLKSAKQVVDEGVTMPKVPGYKKPNKTELAKRQACFAFSKPDPVLQKRLHELNDQIKFLKIEQRAVVKAIKNKNMLKKLGTLKPVHLYALELENGCVYVGMSFNPEKRFKKHLKGKGAIWTQLNKPIKIMEVRVTEFYDQDEVAKLEDDMTVEYALKYGSDKVRGGGYCQMKPRWPDVVIQNELVIQ